jgi:putative ABC transport system permease protein
VFAARNLVRRPQRFIATVALLAAGGALFLAGINSSEAWQRWVDDGLERRSYDAQLHFAGPVKQSEVDAVLSDVDGVSDWETLVSLPATPADSSGSVRIQRIYPDGGHGLFVATAIDPETELVDVSVREGEWLDGSANTVVLNQAAATRLANPAIGSTTTLSLEGTAAEWTIVGVIDEVGSPATVYVPTGELDAALGAPSSATSVQIVAADDTAATIERAQAALASAGIVVASTVPTTELASAIDNHVVVFVAVLIALAVLMAIIGALGLASAMSMSVIERTREYGVMKAIGASSRFVRSLVLSEAVMTGGIGFIIAAAASVPVSALVGSTLGNLAFSTPLPLVISGGAIVTWAVIAVLGAALASVAAASRSARLTVRESLAHQ